MSDVRKIPNTQEISSLNQESSLMVPPPWQPLHYLPTQSTHVLDIGCNVGELLQSAENLGVTNLYGVDINQFAIAKAQKKFSGRSNYKFDHCSADKLPFPNHSMDAIYICEVIEHVPENLRAGVFSEINRVLKDDGTLILTTPFKGWFHWLDPANLRFFTPGLYNLFSKFVGGAGREKGYQGEKHGVVWHHHFTTPELKNLYSPFFEVKRTRYRGVLLAPLMQYALFPFYRRENYSHPLYKFFRFCKDWELRWNPPANMAFNILITLQKKKSQP